MENLKEIDQVKLKVKKGEKKKKSFFLADPGLSENLGQSREKSREDVVEVEVGSGGAW